MQFFNNICHLFHIGDSFMNPKQPKDLLDNWPKTHFILERVRIQNNNME